MSPQLNGRLITSYLLQMKWFYETFNKGGVLGSSHTNKQCHAVICHVLLLILGCIYLILRPLKNRTIFYYVLMFKTLELKESLLYFPMKTFHVLQVLSQVISHKTCKSELNVPYMAENVRGCQ